MLIPQSFFNAKTQKVAKDIIGSYFIVRKNNYVLEKYKIIETEAYIGSNDKACHAHKKRTKRNEIMYGKAGTFYIYFVYGMHYMLNIVTEEIGHPSAILIRGIEDKYGNQIIGPAKVSKTLNISKKYNGNSPSKKMGIWLVYKNKNCEICEDIPVNKIYSYKRVGIDYAGKYWANRKLRYSILKYKK